MEYSPPGSSVHGILQARILEWVAISFSRGIFPTQGSNPGLLHCRQILYQLSYEGRPPLVPPLLLQLLPLLWLAGCRRQRPVCLTQCILLKLPHSILTTILEVGNTPILILQIR